MALQLPRPLQGEEPDPRLVLHKALETHVWPDMGHGCRTAQARLIRDGELRGKKTASVASWTQFSNFSSDLSYASACTTPSQVSPTPGGPGPEALDLAPLSLPRPLAQNLALNKRMRFNE